MRSFDDLCFVVLDRPSGIYDSWISPGGLRSNFLWFMMFFRDFTIMCFLSSVVTTRLRGELRLKLMGSLPRDWISSMNRPAPSLWCFLGISQFMCFLLPGSRPGFVGSFGSNKWVRYLEIVSHLWTGLPLYDVLMIYDDFDDLWLLWREVRQFEKWFTIHSLLWCDGHQFDVYLAFRCHFLLCAIIWMLHSILARRLFRDICVLTFHCHFLIVLTCHVSYLFMNRSYY